MSDTVDILVHGQRCPEWKGQPDTLEGWRALELIADVDGDMTTWRCPACGADVYHQWVAGTLEFGV